MSPIIKNLNDPKNQIMALDILDYLMNEKNPTLHEGVAKKEFFGLIVKILKFKEPVEVK